MEMAFDLEVKTNRPIIKLDYLFIGCTALLDTGALIPIWTKEAKLLEALGAKLYEREHEFSGFGGKAIGDMYKLDLKFGNIMYPQMPIIVHNNEKIPGYFLFSATMFRGMIYTIDDITKKFIVISPDNQVCRNLTIIDNNGEEKILVNY